MRSYFDIMNKLSDKKDRLEFLEAIINKQFLDEEPEGLSYVVDLAYESQRHQIEKSIKGYKDAKNQDLKGNPIKTPIRGATKTPTKTPARKVKGKRIKDKGKRNNTTYTYPSLEEFMVYAKSKIPEEEYKLKRQKLMYKFEAWNSDNWINRRTDKKIVNWKTTLLNTIPHL